MSLPTFPDVEDFLNPLTESNPVGPYLSYEDEYFELEEARRADDDASSLGDWTRQRKTSDWNKIISLGEVLLREKSKDLQIAAWLTEALVHAHGLAGMRHGLSLVRQLQNRFWELVHPAGGDLELRQGVYEFLDEEKILPLLVRSVPLTEVNGVPDLSYSYLKYKESRETENLARKPSQDIDLDEMLAGRLRAKQFDDAFEATERQFYVKILAEVNECIIEIEHLNKDIKERWSAKTPAPQLTRVLVALRDVEKLAKLLLDRKPAPSGAREPEAEEEVPQEEKEGPHEEETEAHLETEPSPVQRSESQLRPARRERISSDQEAHQQIIQAACFLRKSNPADPTSYLVLRALGMGGLYQKTESLESATFPSPSSELRERLHGLEKSEDSDHWTQLLDESEQVIGQPEGCGWLDVQRYSLITMAALGWENAERACRAVLSACLRDHPQWPQLLLKDGTPCASEATKNWLRTQKRVETGDSCEKIERLREPENPSTTPGNRSDDGQGAAPNEVDPWDEAQTLARVGNTSEAIAVMARAARQACSGRERFLRTLQQAELCLALGLSELALPLLDVLAQRVDDLRLEQWEDSSLCARVFSNLYRCLREQDAARARIIYNRLCQLDLSEALALGGT